MNELDFALNTKALDDTGVIEGIAAGYGNLDYGGDIILPGAMAKSIAGRKSVPMLMYHNQQRPAGVWNHFEETSDGLLVKGRFAMSTRSGKEAHSLVMDGAIGGLSIGYDAVKSAPVGRARHLAEVNLHEISLVTIPMNARAQVTGVKAIVDDGGLPTLSQFEDFLREAGFSKSQATAIAGKGLASLIRGEPGNGPADFLSALAAQLRA